MDDTVPDGAERAGISRSSRWSCVLVGAQVAVLATFLALAWGSRQTLERSSKRQAPLPRISPQPDVVAFLRSADAPLIERRLNKQGVQPLKTYLQFRYAANSQRVDEEFRRTVINRTERSTIDHELAHAIAGNFEFDQHDGHGEAFAQLYALSRGASPHTTLAAVVGWARGRQRSDDYYPAAVLILSAYERHIRHHPERFPRIKQDRPIVLQLNELTEREITEIASTILHLHYGLRRREYAVGATQNREPSERSYKEAVRSLRARDFATARDFFETSIKDASNAQAFNAFGLFLSADYDDTTYSAEYAEAIRLLEIATQLEPENAAYWNDLIVVALQIGWYETAWNALQSATRLHQTDVRFALAEGDLLAARAEYERAEEVYDRALRHHPRDPELLHRRVLLALYKAGRFTSDAIRILEELLRLDPGHAEAHFLLASHYRLTNNQHMQIQHLQGFVRAQPRSSVAHQLLAGAYVDANQQDLAAQALERAVEVEPENLELQDRLAITYFSGRQYEEARRTCEKRLARSPGSVYARGILTTSLWRLNRFEESLASAALLERDFGSDEVAMATLGPIRQEVRAMFRITSVDAAHKFFQAERLFHGRQFAEAATLYRAAVAVEPGFAKAWLHLGDAYFRLRDYGKALPHYKKALEIDERDKQGWAYLGDAFYELGRVHEACQAYGKSLEIDPGYWLAMKNVRAAKCDRNQKHD